MEECSRLGLELENHDGRVGLGERLRGKAETKVQTRPAQFAGPRGSSSRYTLLRAPISLKTSFTAHRRLRRRLRIKEESSRRSSCPSYVERRVHVEEVQGVEEDAYVLMQRATSSRS